MKMFQDKFMARAKVSSRGSPALILALRISEAAENTVKRVELKELKDTNLKE
jgi:hypothetical protein